MHSSVVVTKPAPDKALITLYEAKVALKIAPSSTDSDELLKFIILRSKLNNRLPDFTFRGTRCSSTTLSRSRLTVRFRNLI
jgi:hypothetical protein